MLPLGEAAGHRRYVRVAELHERFRDERRSRAGGAVDDHLARLVRDHGFDARFEIAARDVDCARKVPLVPLVLFADIEKERPVARGQAVMEIRRVDLVDLGLDLIEKLAVGRHYFQEYSVPCSSRERPPLASRLPFGGDRPHENDPRCCRPRTDRGRSSRRDHRRVEQRAYRRRRNRTAGAPGGSAAFARPRNPGRPRGRRPPRRNAPLRGREASRGRRAIRTPDSLEARIGQAFAAWPENTVTRLTELSGLHPKSAAVQLNLGIARYWAGEAGSKEAWQSAAELEPDTAYAVTAGNLLHPEFARNLPLFVPVADVPPAVTRLDPSGQFAALERRARNRIRVRSPLLRSRAAAAREAALRRACLRRGRATPSVGSRGPGRRRGRPVRQGTAGTRILPARAASRRRSRTRQRFASISASCFSGRGS